MISFKLGDLIKLYDRINEFDPVICKVISLKKDVFILERLDRTINVDLIFEKLSKTEIADFIARKLK